jgi:DNA-binding response OmpR family regulator
MASILICEPNHSTRSVLVNALRDEDFEIFTAEDGRDASQQILTKSPDFVLIEWLDFDIRNMDIETFLRQMKRLRPETLFVFMSHKGPQKTVENFATLVADHGADAFVIKPFHPATVLEKLRNLQGQTTP